MADIERWITMNGAHIPIIKGESRARAVANFIKSRKEQKLKGGYGSKKAIDKLKRIAKKSEDEYRKTPDIDDHKQRGSFLSSKEVAAIKKAQDQDEVDMALRYRRSKYPSVKGYSTDPYNRVKKAEKEGNATYQALSRNVENAERSYAEEREHTRNKFQNLRENLRKKYPNYMKNDLDYAKYHGEFDLAEQRARYREDEAERNVRQAKSYRDYQTKDAYMDELNKEYSGYKLKTGTNPRKSQTIRGTTKTAGMKAADKQYKADVKSNRAYDKKYGKPTYSQIESDNRWRLAQIKKDRAYRYTKKKK